MIRRSSRRSWPVLAAILASTVFGPNLLTAFNGGGTKATPVALPVTPPPGSFTGDNTGLTTPPVPNSQTWHNVTWWTWTPSVTMTIGVRATSLTAWDNTLEVWAGSPAVNLVADNDDFYGLDAQVTFTAEAGVPHVIGLGGFGTSSTGTATIRFFDVPNPAPTAVSATPGNGAALVTWAMANADDQSVTTYLISRYIGGVQNGGTTSVSGFPPPTARNITGLTNGTAYTFKVQAINSVGPGALSNPSSAVTPTGPPGAPTSVSGLAGNAQVTVSFTPPANNGGSPITSYTVTATSTVQTATGTGSPLVVTGLTNGTAYTFRVRATNSLGAGSFSAASAPVTPNGPVLTVPGAPTAVSAVARDREAIISFSPPASDGGAPLDLYRVTASPGGLTNFSSGSPIGIGPLTNGTAYTFTVSVSNSVGRGPESAPSSPVTPVAVVSTASRPENVSAVAGFTQATISFSPPVFDGNAAITSYLVTTLSGIGPTGQTATGAGSPIVVTGLTNGTQYFFRVQAINSAGVGSQSNPSNVVIPFTIPGAPTALSGVAQNQQATVSFAPPANDGFSTITSYTVTSSGGQTATGAGSPIVVAGLSNGTPYTFTALATNRAGSGPSSVASPPVIPASVPGPPTAVSAVAGNAQATISFAAPASAGGAPITSYAITASPGGETAAGAGSPIVMVSLNNGIAYTFVVQAINSMGVGPQSAPSSPVTPSGPATVPGAPTAVSAAAGDAQAIVSFVAPDNNGGAPISSYAVTASPGGQTAVGAGSPLLVTGLVNGTAYTFTVRASNRAGPGAPSSASSPVTPSASCPVVLSLTDLVAPAIGVGGLVSLTTSAGCAWTATSSAAWVVIAPTSGIGSTGLTFVVHENNGEGARSATVLLASVGSATLRVAQQARVSAPGSPVDLSASVAGNAARFEWHAVGAGGGATDHVLEAGSAPGLSDLAQVRTGSARTFYEVRDVPDGTYYVRVRSVNAQGVSGPSNEVVVVAPGHASGLPGAPAGLLPLAAEGMRLGVRWSPPTQGLVSGYRVEFGTAPGASDVGRVDVPLIETSFSWDSAALPEGTYYVRVRGVNGEGQGPPSIELTLTFGQRPGRAPSRPMGLAASISDSQLTLTWNAPLGGGAATGYVVEVSTVPGTVNLYQAVVAASPTLWSFPLVPSGAYYLRVRGLNAFGVGLPSDEIAAGVVPSGPLPGTPRGLSARVEGQGLTLLWTAPADGGSVAQYVIDAGSAPGSSDLASLGTGTSLTEWSYDGVPDGVTIFIRVRAQNPVGSGAASNEVRIGDTTGPADTTPGVPSNLVATETASTITAAWEPSVSGADPASYVLTILSADHQPIHVVELLTRSVTASLRDIAPGTYYVEVRAKGANGQMSDATSAVAVVVPQP